MTVDDGRSERDTRTYTAEAPQGKEPSAVPAESVAQIRAVTIAAFLEQAAEVIWPQADKSAR